MGRPRREVAQAIDTNCDTLAVASDFAERTCSLLPLVGRVGRQTVAALFDVTDADRDIRRLRAALVRDCDPSFVDRYLATIGEAIDRARAGQHLAYELLVELDSTARDIVIQADTRVRRKRRTNVGLRKGLSPRVAEAVA